MNHLDSIVTKLDVVGVKLYINEAEKVNFYVYFKKYLVKSPCYFGQKCNQQVFWAVFWGYISVELEINENI